MFELNLSAMETACCSAMHVHFTHYVVRDRLDTSPRREVTSRSVNLFRELFQVFDMIVTISARFVSVMLRVRSIVLMHVPSLVRTCENVVLKHLFVDGRLRRRFKSGFPSSTRRVSML